MPITAVIVVLAIISFLVLIHEAGHFIAAKRNKINVEEFGLGFPPKITTLFTWKNTDFTLNAIPFGGFVRLEGEDASSEELIQAKIKKNKWAPFYAKTAGQRMEVVLAGVLVNFVFAIVAFTFVFSFLGIPNLLDDQARIETVASDSPAANVNLPTNVNIVEISTNQQTYKIDGFKQVQDIVAESRGQNLELTVTGECQQLQCPQETQTYLVYARSEQETSNDQGALGITFKNAILVFYPWYEMPVRASWYGIKQSLAFGYLIVKTLIDMTVHLVSSGQVPTGLAGPIGIVDQASQGNVITDNFWENLGFAAMLSLNLAVMNLLPIPALDGGRALFILLEKIFGRKKISKVEAYANYGGFAILMALIIIISINDIVRIVMR